MYYGNIKNFDVADGPGCRVSLFVSGCRNHCPGCFNEETWDFSFGERYTEETTDRILESIGTDDMPSDVRNWLRESLMDQLGQKGKMSLDKAMDSVVKQLKSDEMRAVMELHSLRPEEVFSRDYLKAVRRECAEIVKSFSPDIVTVDANEPQTDHWDINQMEFFDNRDKGNGARNFFTSIAQNGMKDAYSCVFDKDSFVPGEYLATSHLVARGKKRERRYDFIFVHSGTFDVKNCSYSFEEARQASADHAIVRAELEILKKEGALYLELSSKETMIKERMSVCRYWHGEDKCDKLLASYERLWVNMIDEDPEYLQYLINGYIQRGLELFSLDDGVPVGLKALLFNRYEHWSSGYEDIVGGFKEWYFSDYLCQKRKST